MKETRSLYEEMKLSIAMDNEDWADIVTKHIESLIVSIDKLIEAMKALAKDKTPRATYLFFF